MQVLFALASSQLSLIGASSGGSSLIGGRIDIFFIWPALGREAAPTIMYVFHSLLSISDHGCRSTLLLMISYATYLTSTKISFIVMHYGYHSVDIWSALSVEYSVLSYHTSSMVSNMATKPIQVPSTVWQDYCEKCDTWHPSNSAMAVESIMDLEKVSSIPSTVDPSCASMVIGTSFAMLLIEAQPQVHQTGRPTSFEMGEPWISSEIRTESSLAAKSQKTSVSLRERVSVSGSDSSREPWISCTKS